MPQILVVGGYASSKAGERTYIAQLDGRADETSAECLNGALVDFQDGLNGKGFAIENPNSTGSCGCGQSFSC